MISGFNELELKSLLGDEFDQNNAYLTLHAGAGERKVCVGRYVVSDVYAVWERQGFKIQIDFQAGEKRASKVCRC